MRAGRAQWVVVADDTGVLRQLAFGADPEFVGAVFATELYPLAYPTFGENLLALPALRVTNSSGVLSTRLTFDSHAQDDHGDGHSHRIRLVDTAQPLTVTLCVRTWDRDEIFEAWVEVTNDQPGPITLHEVAASAPALTGDDPRFDHYAGGWASEFTPVHDRLTTGVKVIEARGTTRPNDETAPYFRFSPDGPATETSGTVLAGALAWGGNFRIAFERSRVGHVRAWTGHLATGADYSLDPGETFLSPTMTWAWSAAGTRPLTHRLHHWIRDHGIRDGHRPRAIVANNWEAMGFDFDQDRLVEFCSTAADLGAELFLLDDGWFGDEFPRNDDDAGLGDWMVNRRKLPGGLAAVGDAAADAGVRFGVWIEPEMVNPASALYRDHPDWVVSEVGRPRREERNQLLLDLCREDVQAHVIAVADGVLDPFNKVSYVKWDANRSVSEPGSTALHPHRQGRWPVDVVRATWDVMDTIGERWPDTELMLCASGGGRIDLGTLRRFHEVWLSDNTDPVDRLVMQWHAAEFLPANVLAAHVTLWGMRPLRFACAVAMTARFGFDLNRAYVSEADWGVCRRAAAAYRTIRDVVQQGDLMRLVSPDDGPNVALAYVSADRSEAVAFGFRLPHGGTSPDEDRPHDFLHLAGLDVQREYLVASIDLADPGPGDPVPGDPVPGEHGAAQVGDRVPGRSDNRVTTTGQALQDAGIAWPNAGPLTASIWHLTAV